MPYLDVYLLFACAPCCEDLLPVHEDRGVTWPSPGTTPTPKVHDVPYLLPDPLI